MKKSERGSKNNSNNKKWENLGIYFRDCIISAKTDAMYFFNWVPLLEKNRGI